jgi:hypothetical protein
MFKRMFKKLQENQQRRADYWILMNLNDKNEAGNYTKPTLRKRLFERIKRGTKGGKAGQWSARKAQLLASEYKKAGGGYK